jgi:branched-subunit amino acid aminotransferase/4-amino-4-deoxychorismate lyase
MINGTIISEDATVLTKNRAFSYGDAVFETVKIINNKILFSEDHYLGNVCHASSTNGNEFYNGIS